MQPPVVWLGEDRVEGELGFRIGRAGNELVAEWPGLGTLRADRQGNVSRLLAEPGADPEIIAKLGGGIGRALLRHLKGELTLHASAVSIGGSAVACFGESGSGKSTLIAHLASKGALFFADDTVAIELDRERVEISPAESVSWLLPDARTAIGATSDDAPHKRPVKPGVLASARAPLVALISLRFDDAIDAPRIRRIRGQLTLARLVPCVIRFIIDEPTAQVRECDQLARLTTQVPVFELARPRHLPGLAASAEALQLLLETLAAGASCP